MLAAVDVRWWKYLHVIGAFGFIMAHGVSMTVALRLRKERDRTKIAELLQFSGSSILWMYLSLGWLLLFAVVSATANKYWGQKWIWYSLGILVALIGEMSAVARPYYQRVKEAVEIRPSGVPRKSDEELDLLLRSKTALANTAIGFVGLLAIVYLMIFKPL